MRGTLLRNQGSDQGARTRKFSYCSIDDAAWSRLTSSSCRLIFLVGLHRILRYELNRNGESDRGHILKVNGMCPRCLWGFDVDVEHIFGVAEDAVDTSFREDV